MVPARVHCRLQLEMRPVVQVERSPWQLEAGIAAWAVLLHSPQAMLSRRSTLVARLLCRVAAQRHLVELCTCAVALHLLLDAVVISQSVRALVAPMEVA